MYGEWYFLDGLAPGEHIIRVELSSNDHATLSTAGASRPTSPAFSTSS